MLLWYGNDGLPVLGSVACGFDTAPGVWGRYVRDVRWIGCEGVAPINRKISKSAQENHRLSNEAKRSQTNPKVPRREYDILLL